MKRLLAILLVFALCLGLCACGSDSTDKQSTTPAETTTQPVETTQPTTPAETTTQSVETTIPEPVAKSIVWGEKYIIEDVCEFTFEYGGFTYDLHARMSSNSRLHVAEAGDGEVLVYVKMNYTNLSTTTMNFSKSKSEGFKNIYGCVNSNKSDWKLLYNNKYEYSIEKHSAVEDNLDPLCSTEVYYVFSLPEAVKNESKPMVFSFTLHGEKYTLACEAEGAAELSEIFKGELYSVENYGDMVLTDIYRTEKLMPKKPSGYYSYYEAPSGYHFIVAEFQITNGSSSSEGFAYYDLIKGCAVIDGKEIEGECVIGSAKNDDLGKYGGFQPGEERTVFFFVKVSDKFLEQSGELKLTMLNSRITIKF